MVRLLGRLQVERDGHAIGLRGKKAAALLAYLAVPPGRRHSRADLADLLWGQMDDERARHNLRQCVSALRRALGDGVIASDGDALYLDPETADVDADRLEGAQASRAAQAYRGEFLEGLSLREDPFDEWLADQRASLKRLACDRLAVLASARAAAGATDEAIEAARSQVTLDPTSEDGHRLLMTLYARSGRRSAAIRQYEICVAALGRHLGVRPSPQTARLYDTLRHSAAGDRAEAEQRSEVTGLPTSPELPNRPSIVVLPLANLDGSPDRDYFGIGIAEDITAALSRFGTLFVISATTAYAFRRGELEPRRIGRDLGVRYVVHGSVRRAGTRIRVNVHLMDVPSANEVWSQRYDRGLHDVFAVQDEITATVVATLVSRVEAASLQRLRRTAPGSLTAYDCFLRGKDYHHRWTAEDSVRSIEMFERAVAIDPAYALAHAWLACALYSRTFFDPDPALVTRCFDEVQKAHALDDSESEVHRMLAAFHLASKDFEKAELYLDRALALNPNHDRSVCQRGELATYCGRPEEGEQWVRRAMRLNPFCLPRDWLRLAQALYHRSRFEQSLEALYRERLAVPHAPTYMAASLARLGRRDEARAVLDEIRKERGSVTILDLVQPLPYRRLEDAEAVAEALRLAGLRE